MKIKNIKSLIKIYRYFSNLDENFSSKGNFIIDHFFYFIDDIYNYNKENNNLDDNGKVLFRGIIDEEFMNIYDYMKNIISQEYDSNLYKFIFFKQFILNNRAKIYDIVYKYRNVVAQRTSKRQYDIFVNGCYNFLEFYEQKNKKQIKDKIKFLLDTLFSYDKKYDEKIEARSELKKILNKLKKEFKDVNSSNFDNLEKLKPFLMWKDIFNASTNKDFESAIDRHRERYLKENNIKYFETKELYSGMVQTNIIFPMNFLRGMYIPDDLCEEEMRKELKEVKDKIKKIGKDKPIVKYYEEEEKYEGEGGIKEETFKLILDDCLKNGIDSLRTNFVAINNQYNIDGSHIHEGLLSGTTNLDIANKYSIGKENERENKYPIIFLINPNIGTNVFNPILGDQRSFAYSETDFITIPPESIIGYFKVVKNKNNLEYIFHKNQYIDNDILEKKFIDKNGNRNELKDNEIYTRKDIENILRETNGEFKEMQKYYILKSIEIAKYLMRIKDEATEDCENLYDDIMEKLFKENKERVYYILKILSSIKKGDVEEILNTKKFYQKYYTKLDIFYCDIISPIDYTTGCHFYPIANIYNYFKSNDKLKYINEEIEDGFSEFLKERVNTVNTNVELELKAENGEFNKDNIYCEINNWINYINEYGIIEWFYKDVDKPLTKRKTKINIAVDPEPENFLKAQIIFRKFLDKYELYGKMPPENENGRNTLIIYSQLTEEQLAELEENLKEAEIRPKLLSCNEYVCDIGIKNSLYLYFKCDGFEYYDENDEENKEAYCNIQQVEYMDKVRKGIYDNDEDTSIKIYRNYTDITKNRFSKDNYFKNYSDGYFEYLKIIRKCNAVQRQLLDLIFRVELKEEKGDKDENGKKLWDKELFKYLTPEFIESKLNIIKNFVENTKDKNEIELRKLLNNLVKEKDENFEPELDENCIKFVNSFKEYSKDEKQDEIKNNKLENVNYISKNIDFASESIDLLNNSASEFIIENL